MSGTGASIIPRIDTMEEFDRRRREPEWTRRAVEEICARHGIATAALSRYGDGSAIVFATGEGRVVKLFASIFRRNFETERSVLTYIEGRLPVPTPKVLATGELEEWPYVIMEEIAGTPAKYCWERIPFDDRVAIARDLGEALAALHTLPTESLTIAAPDWNEFIARQSAGCAERQRKLGAPEEWVKGIPEFLASVAIAPPERPVLLHTEIMRDHLLVRPRGDRWEIAGLIDFEPATIGHPEYEFASVGLFFSAGDPALLLPLMRSYGYAGMTPDLARRLMLYALLHRYSNLAWYLREIPPTKAATLDELALEWWGF